MERSTGVVVFALISNIFLSIGKFLVALISGSAGLMAEFFHSSSDTLNQLLLLLGIKKSYERDRKNFPFGKGKEQYFWSFIASILFIEFSGLLSIVEGYMKIQHPYVLSNYYYIYIIIAISFIFDGSALLYTINVMRKNMREGGYSTFKDYMGDIRDSVLMNALMEDLGAILGIIIIFFGSIFTQIFDNYIYDSISSFCVGILLIIIGIYLANINRDLLVGKGLTSMDRKKIMKILEGTNNVNEVINIDGIYMGPNSIILGLDLNFRDGLTTDEIERTVDYIEKRIKEELPYVRTIFIEAEEIKKKL